MASCDFTHIWAKSTLIDHGEVGGTTDELPMKRLPVRLNNTADSCMIWQ